MLRRVCLAPLLILLLPLAALADDSRDAAEARAAVARGAILPLSVILPDLEQRFSARLLDAELEDDDDRMIYEIEMLTTDGRVIELDVDARTARILEMDEDD